MPLCDEYFAEHIRTRKVKPPKTLYKYTTVETAQIVLSTGKLRFQSPLRYNDPFDSQWNTLWPLFTPEAREYERMLFEKAIRDPGSWPDNADLKNKELINQARERIDALPEEQREGEIVALAKKLTETITIPDRLKLRHHDTQRQLRVLCLSACDRSILMWSHYADQHSGVVLGFDTDVMENGRKCPFEPVVYKDGPPQLFDPEEWIRSTLFGLPDKPELNGREREWALTKHSSWQYEREWRFASTAAAGTLGDYGDYNFPRDALVELVMGCRTDTVKAVELQSLAYHFRPDVRHFQMSQHPSRFELDKTEVPAGEAAPPSSP